VAEMKGVKKVMNLLVLSCKRATKLIEKREIDALTVLEKMQLKLHTSMCDVCHAYKKQSTIIDKAIFRWIKSNKQEKHNLSDESKSKIINKIKES
jgi:hypothetical protein